MAGCGTDSAGAEARAKSKRASGAGPEAENGPGGRLEGADGEAFPRTQG